MIKLYKHTADGRLAYHEAWVADGTVTEHWGIVGTPGESRDQPMTARDVEEALQRVLATVREAGYEEIAPEEERILIVEYSIEGMGTSSDLEKRHRLEKYLNETLGRNGLGRCDGGSIGFGTMEVCCFVVDFDRSKTLIETSLKDTEFADYSRMYDEDDES
jgi:hypothetical protein